MSNTKTLNDIRTICYWLIKQPENCSAYPYTLFDTFINKAQNDICFWNVTNMRTKQKIEKQNLFFLNETAFFVSVQPSTLSWPAVIWSSTLDVTDTSNYLSSWALWINWNIITYTWKIPGSFTWIPITWSWSIKWTFTWWTKAFQLYALPSDYGQMTNSYYDTGNAWYQFKMIGFDYREFKEPTLNSLLYRFFRDDFSISIREFYYTLINWKYFLPFLPQSWNAIRFEYQKRPLQLVNWTDLATIPDEYCLNTVPYLATAEMLYNRWEPDVWLALSDMAFENTSNMYRFYQTQTKELIFWQRIRTSHDWMVNI